jgi:hypothetical protein
MRENLHFREQELGKCHKTIAERAATLMKKLESKPVTALPTTWAMDAAMCPA